MKSILLEVIGRAVGPVAFLFAIYLFLRGHHEPGGGFVAGLVMSVALWLRTLALGCPPPPPQRFLPLLVLGLGGAIFSGAFGLLGGKPFLTHVHGPFFLSTAMLFDVGVLAIVVGTAGILISSFTEVNQ